MHKEWFGQKQKNICTSLSAGIVIQVDTLEFGEKAASAYEKKKFKIRAFGNQLHAFPD